MEIEKVERINELIKKAEIESAKSEGQVQAIKKEWKKNYGTDDLEEIKNKLDELISEKNKNLKRQEVLYNKLIESYDWESLEEEIG